MLDRAGLTNLIKLYVNKRNLKGKRRIKLSNHTMNINEIGVAARQEAPQQQLGQQRELIRHFTKTAPVQIATKQQQIATT